MKQFAAVYGADPEGVWAAPGRVNLIGEHTDYNDGFVLPFALPQRTVVGASMLDTQQWTVWSEQADERIEFDLSEHVSGWGAYVAGVVWALREAGFDVPGARMAITSDVPLGAGLSSSAALESAVLTALVDLGGLDLPVDERPALAQRAENDYAGMPCGIMDQSASIRCRAGHALFLDCRSLEVEHIPFDVAAAGLAVLVIDTKAPHRHVTGEYAARRAACEEAARVLGIPALRDATPDSVAAITDPVLQRRARHVVTEDQRVIDTVALLRDGRVRDIGPLMTASHTSMRDDFEITVPEVDAAVEAAISAGAYGARMTGGGFGGCVLALADTDATDTVAAAVAESFATRGFAPPEPFVAIPGHGAVRL
ncbi:galactokinase [Phytohabitans kaempferiae]|uniref:Galactokinase n=1 Tax=Phytohabitans kaempferiae TaxID=1620943 RepID=A0ABV6M0Y0_9ACTN